MKKLEDYQVIWLTGQPGAGKTTIGNKIHSYIEQQCDKKAVIIDGDDIRLLFENKDYTIEGRQKNIIFVQKMVDFLVKNDILPIVCLVSPFRTLREATKAKYDTLELYMVCNKIRGREKFHVDYYEPPLEKYIQLDTTIKSKNETFQELLTISISKLDL